MDEEQTGDNLKWDEENSLQFLDVARYFVPEREQQIELMRDLIPGRNEPFNVLELCCGEGLLAEAILEKFPNATVYGLDGSQEMLKAASARLARFGDRFVAGEFDLVSPDWRSPGYPVHAVVSSLAIHHLDGPQKEELYQDIYPVLEPSGVFVIADLVQPAGQLAIEVTARALDEAVRQRAMELDGDERAFRLFRETEWNIFHYPDPMDKPSRIFEQLKWLEGAGFVEVDVYWVLAGHAIYGGRKADS